MKVIIEQTDNKDVERILTAAYGTPEKIPSKFQEQEGVATNFVGFLKPRVHFMVPAGEEVKKGSPIIVERDGEKVCKQLKAVKVQDFSFEKKKDGLATNHIFKDSDGEMLGYVRLYAGLVTFCTPIIAKLAENEGCKDAKSLVSEMKDGQYKLVYILDYAYPGEK